MVINKNSMMPQRENHYGVSSSISRLAHANVAGHCSGTPTHTTALRSTGSEKYWHYTSNLYHTTPRICNAVPSWRLSLEERERRRTRSPPICTAIRTYLYRSTPHICIGNTFEKIPVGGVLEFLSYFNKSQNHLQSLEGQ